MNMEMMTLLCLIVDVKILIDDARVNDFYCEFIKHINFEYEPIRPPQRDVFVWINKCHNHPRIANIFIDSVVHAIDIYELITIIGNYHRYDLLDMIPQKYDNMRKSGRLGHHSGLERQIRFQILIMIKSINNLDGFVTLVKYFNITIDEYLTLLEHIKQRELIFDVNAEIFDYIISCVSISEILLQNTELIYYIFKLTCAHPGLSKYLPMILKSGQCTNDKIQMKGLVFAIRYNNIEAVKLLVPLLKSKLSGQQHISLDFITIKQIKNVEVLRVLYDNELRYDASLSLGQTAELSDLGYKIESNNFNILYRNLINRKNMLSIIFKNKLDRDTLEHMLKFAVGYVDIYVGMTARQIIHKIKHIK